MSDYFASPTTQRRRAAWQRIFGTDRLPVLDVRPRLAEFRDGPRLVYDVAMSRLHDGQRDRLAAHLARRGRVSYEDARSQVARSGLTIRAQGVKIVTADAMEHRAFQVSLNSPSTTSPAASSGKRLRAAM